MVRVALGRHGSPDVGVHRLDGGVEISPDIAQMDSRSGDCFPRSQHAERVHSDRPGLECKTVVPLKLHDVVGRPRQLTEEILSAAVISQEKVRIVRSQTLRLLEHVRPMFQICPAKPSLPKRSIPE